MREKGLMRVAIYSCTGCILHKDTWPRGQTGTEMQPM